MCVSFLGFVVSSIFLKRFPAYTEEDFKVLFTLFVFLVIIKGLQLSKLLDYIAVKIERGSFVSLKLVLFSAFISMFITNDVALMVVVPLTLAMKIPDIEKTIILETIAVNGGSAVSPFGNPQNIFIYFHYHVHFFDFIKEIFPLFIFSLMLLIIFTPKIKEKVELKGEIPSVNKEGYVYLAFFVLFVVAILRFLPLWIGIVPVIFSLVFRRETLKIDYPLLMTFFFFFGFTDNLDHLFKVDLTDSKDVFLSSAFLSQIISNVPATLFLADFTNNWQALLWGVSVGGFGNLIGSLANIIAYRFYVESRGNSLKFLLKMHILGYIFFTAGIVLFFLVYN